MYICSLQDRSKKRQRLWSECEVNATLWKWLIFSHSDELKICVWLHLDVIDNTNQRKKKSRAFILINDIIIRVPKQKHRKVIKSCTHPVPTDMWIVTSCRDLITVWIPFVHFLLHLSILLHLSLTSSSAIKHSAAFDPDRHHTVWGQQRWQAKKGESVNRWKV